MSLTYDLTGNTLNVDGVTSTGAISGTALTTTGTVTIDGTTLIISDLPTADPSVAGQIWANTGVLTVSAG